MASELLAPAGSIASLNAALRAGADAVYLGLSNFNARHGAENFTCDNLGEVCTYCHLRGTKVYLTVNTLVITKEIDELTRMIESAYLAGVDAFIVQDIGIASTLSRTFGREFVHISTQMNIHNLQGVDAAYSLGAGRITLARELNLGEIEKICSYAHDLGLEIETFVHGAICVCYSGQCLMSSMIGGRSANRGMCAQACRLPYELLMGESKRNVGRCPGDYLLSPKDMCNVDHLDELASAGVDSFKIEGRMKSPEYVSSVVNVYRRAIDSREPISTRDRDRLASSFSRGFTDAYLNGKRDSELMSFNRPNNRGVFVGRVKKITSDYIEIATEKKLAVKDVINIWNKRGGTVVEIDKDALIKDDRVTLHNSSIFKDVRQSDRVFRVRDANSSFVQDFTEPKISVSGHLKLRLGERIDVKVTSNGIENHISGEVVERARTKVVTRDEIIEHFDRLGGTDFILEDLQLDLDENVGIGFSQIHKLRSKALDGLKERLVKQCQRKDEKRIATVNVSEVQRPEAAPSICVIATNPENARAALKAGAIVYVPAVNYSKGSAIYCGCSTDSPSQTTYPSYIKIIMPIVNRGKYNFDNYIDAGGGVLCDDIGSYLSSLERGVRSEVGQMIPITNIHSATLMNKLGADCIWLSPELNLAQIKSITSMISCEVGIYAYGRQRLMVTEHCELMSAGPCDEDCVNCRRRSQPSWLKDRKDVLFPTITDMCGRTTIYNSVDLDVMPYFGDLLDAGVSRFMIDATFLDKEHMLSIITRAKESLKRPPQKRLKDTTSGHLFRGV